MHGFEFLQNTLYDDHIPTDILIPLDCDRSVDGDCNDLSAYRKLFMINSDEGNITIIIDL